MDNLEDIAEFISFSSTFVCDAVFFILQLSYLVGQTLVNALVQIINYFQKLYEIVDLILNIIYEDSSVFFQDAGEKCLLIINFLINSGTIVLNTIWSGIGTVGIGVSHFGNALWLLISTILSVLSNTFFFLQQGLIFIRQILILLGSSIWLCITVIPFTVMYYSQILKQGVISSITDVQSLSFYLISFVSDSFHNVMFFFFDIPLNSGCGLICGTVFLLIVVKNLKKLCLFISQGLHKLYCCLISFSSSLWSGQFLENKSCNTKPELNNVNVNTINLNNEDDKLCIVCQDNYREIITFPCKHLCLCKVCSVQICKSDKVCPVCRKHVTKTVKVYIP